MGAERATRPAPCRERKAKQILETHEPLPLPEGMQTELDAIMNAYEAEALTMPQVV